MKQFIAMNKESGEIGLCAKVQLYDSGTNEPLANLDGFSISIKSKEFDGYIVESTFSELGNMWLWCTKDHFDKICEIIGEL